MKTQEAKAKYTRPFYLCNLIVKNYSLLSKKNISQCSARTAQNTTTGGINNTNERTEHILKSETPQKVFFK